MIKKTYKGIKRFGKKTVTKVKAIPTHPYYRAVEDATLGGYKQALDDSKKLTRGSVFESKSKKARGIRRAVLGGNL